ncbi:hypothetical protein [Vibrio phage phiKT1028]|nr:hypothetical protein [Vibrio phage phiKT1028]
MIMHYVRFFQELYFRVVYRLDPKQEMFKGYLKHYLGCLGVDETKHHVHNERITRQIEYLTQHGYRTDFHGAVFIAGCIYAQFTLRYPMHHQCLSFGCALADLFRHRHELKEKAQEVVISETLERVYLTETRQLYKDLNKAISSIIS